MGKKPNKLINEKSPYILQHSYNPVAWHPWGDEAFEEEKLEVKTVFFSSDIPVAIGTMSMKVTFLFAIIREK